MEGELNLVLAKAIDSLAKLEILLHLYERPGEIRSAREMGLQLRRAVEEVTPALEELSQTGLIERFALGSGRHIMYGPSDDRHVQELLQMLHARYHCDGASRARLVREALRGSEPAESGPL